MKKMLMAILMPLLLGGLVTHGAAQAAVLALPAALGADGRPEKISDP